MAAALLLWLLRPLNFFVFLILMFTTFGFAFSDPESEALLRLKNSFRNADRLESWHHDKPPCNESEEQWKGVVCFEGSVTGIQINNLGLGGLINIDALVELPSLRTISIVNNSFSGQLPEFNRLSNLRAIYLSMNQFSGEIPTDYFGKMGGLRKVWLSDNNFTGPIPTSLFQLPHITELHLEKNQFNWTIPSFELPSLTQLDLSNNKLEGEIPNSLRKFNASSFSGNPGLCGKKLGVECNKKASNRKTPKPRPQANPDAANSTPTVSAMKSSPEPPADKEDQKKLVAAAITLSVMFISIAFVFVLKWRKKVKAFDVLEKDPGSVSAVELQASGSFRNDLELSRKPGSSRVNSSQVKIGSVGELVMVNDEKGVFGLPDLMKAAAEVLGNGTLRSSYKAQMANGTSVVVKRMKELNAMEKEGFDVEIRKLGMIKHSNILTPLAYLYRKDEKLFVYEFIPKGSLLYLLHGDRGPSHDELNWPTRLNIIKGIASGMEYLHSQLASQDLPHGNLKSSNILLGPNNEPLISEYGLSPLISTPNLGQAMFAYKAPEVVSEGKVSPKCDVYCLGVVILEILTGEFPSQYLNNDKGGTDVVRWVASAMAEGKLTELLDPEIASSTDSLNEMEQLLHIGLACTESDPEKRLEMREAVRRIQEIKSAGEGERPSQLQELPTP
ncbi:pollen receptor-like kinase 3 [Mangifera indica]|uniref:pollen receptor-like kinase 3 n=1 Tax=Mangifera indica TaxID=29780 RepID=UPI001CFA9E8B|nr:pollen receptor-like kinase 3 [Mangifera indica]